MILKGSQRGGGGQLAAHLMNDIDNDHVTLLELRGFLSSDLSGALEEAHAVSKGTRCKQFMFSLSLNPPKGADAGIGSIVDAANRAEEKLGLAGQPRALVVHEKEGRRHAHVVWSRIDADSMTAVNLPFFKSRLAALSKELYLEHGWELPDGHKENGWKNPLNFTLAEWQQAKRFGLDPREIKQVFQSAWQHADGGKSFRAALEDRGYYLAVGDRRGFVAVDLHGEVYSLSRVTGHRTKDLEGKLSDLGPLPSVAAIKRQNDSRVGQELRNRYRELRRGQATLLRPRTESRKRIVEAQRLERTELTRRQEARRIEENRVRHQRMRKGVLGAWDILTGQAAAVRRSNEAEAFDSWRRDRADRERLFEEQMRERAAMQLSIDELRMRQRRDAMEFIRKAIGLLKNEHEKQIWRRPALKI